jgi:hypothetical protein
MIVEDDKQLLKELADITCSLISFVKRNMSHDLTYINIKHLELIEERGIVTNQFWRDMIHLTEGEKFIKYW